MLSFCCFKPIHRGEDRRSTRAAWPWTSCSQEMPDAASSSCSAHPWHLLDNALDLQYSWILIVFGHSAIPGLYWSGALQQHGLRRRFRFLCSPFEYLHSERPKIWLLDSILQNLRFCCYSSLMKLFYFVCSIDLNRKAPFWTGGSPEPAIRLFLKTSWPWWVCSRPSRCFLLSSLYLHIQESTPIYLLMWFYRLVLMLNARPSLCRKIYGSRLSRRDQCCQITAQN